MKKILERLHQQEILSRDEAREILHRIAREEFNDIQLMAFIGCYQMRNISLQELQGFRDALLDLCIAVDLSEFEAIDMCGTGGDGKNTFNVSTTASFIVAAAGYKVAKHGNYGVSSICGSSNVLESLGYQFSTDTARLKRELSNANITFLHAPLFHPAMKSVATVRKTLKMKTFFNMLGPLVNPAQPKYQLTGVFNQELARLYKYILQDCEREFIILHSMDVYDEISLTDEFRMISNRGDRLMHPQVLDLPILNPQQLYGGNSIEESADILVSILSGEGTGAQNLAVAANAGMAIHCMVNDRPIRDCIREALETIHSKKGIETLKSILQ